MSGTLFVPPRYVPVNGSGKPYPLSYLYFYEANSTTLASVYTTAALDVLSPNPLQANSAGQFAAVYLSSSSTDYKVVHKNSAFETLWTEDKIPASFVSSEMIGLELYPRSAAEIAASVTPTDYSQPYGWVTRYGTNTTPGATNMSAAIQAAYSQCVQTGGSPVVFPPQTYLMTSQCTLTAPETRRVEVSGYGATLKTSGAISAIGVTGGGAAGGSATIRGLRIDQTGNASATIGIDIYGIIGVHIDEVTIASDGTSAQYAGVRVRNGTPANAATGSYWARIDRCKFYGSANTFPYGVVIQGASNDCHVLGCEFSGVVVGVRLQTETGESYPPNAAVLERNAFEVFTTAIDAVSYSSEAITGLRIFNNRAEAGTTFFSYTGTSSPPAGPPFLCGNYLQSTVTTYVNNPNSLYITSLDQSITPAIDRAAFFNAKGVRIRATATSEHSLIAQAYSDNKGIALETSVGAEILRISTSTGGTAPEIVAPNGNLNISGVNYIALKDGITAPGTVTGMAAIYVDTADGDLKVKYADGTVKTIVVDT